jgi:hypothetical protein
MTHGCRRPALSTPGGRRRNQQHVVLDPAQYFIRNTADEHTLEQRESAGAYYDQIGSKAVRDLLDRSERRALVRKNRKACRIQTSAREQRVDLT